MKGERRRGRGLLRAVVDDPYRKLMAIGLAVLMWFMVNNRIQKTSNPRSLPLTVVSVSAVRDRSNDELAVVLPNEQVVSRRFLDGTREIQSVEVTVTGPSYIVDAIEEEKLNLNVAREVRTAAAGDGGGDTEFLEFTAADIRREQALLKDVEIHMSPARVRLEYRIEKDIVLPLPPQDPRAIDLSIDPALESRVLRQTTRYFPQSLRVVGRGAELAKLDKRQPPLFRAILRPAGVTGNKVSATLQLVGEDLDLRIDPPATVEIELQPQTKQFTLTVPVMVDDLSLPDEQRRLYEPETPTLSVLTNISGGLLSTLTNKESGDHDALGAYVKANFRLLVPIEPPEAGGALPDRLLDRPAYLIPTGKLLSPPIDRNEYSLAEVVTVNLRRKQ
ncbi:MAG: hypothetical protein H6835_07720 [Planctomycetes bacterium]|nr:hypothetical protein [Planctomycetota bacterium]